MDNENNMFDYKQEDNDKSTMFAKNSRGFVDPYNTKPKHVRMYHFRDARLYDNQIREAGWKVQRSTAKSKYTQWLRAIRKNPDWGNFRRRTRRAEREKKQVIQNTNYVKRKQDTGKNIKHRIVAQSRVPGVGIDDIDFKPKMFTEKMGHAIAQKRNELGLTQAELGKKINVAANMIRNIEIGGLISYNPADRMVKDLARALTLDKIEYVE